MTPMSAPARPPPASSCTTRCAASRASPGLRQDALPPPAWNALLSVLTRGGGGGSYSAATAQDSVTADYGGGGGASTAIWGRMNGGGGGSSPQERPDALPSAGSLHGPAAPTRGSDGGSQPEHLRQLFQAALLLRLRRGADAPAGYDMPERLLCDAQRVCVSFACIHSLWSRLQISAPILDDLRAGRSSLSSPDRCL